MKFESELPHRSDNVAITPPPPLGTYPLLYNSTVAWSFESTSKNAAPHVASASPASTRRAPLPRDGTTLADVGPKPHSHLANRAHVVGFEILSKSARFSLSWRTLEDSRTRQRLRRHVTGVFAQQHVEAKVIVCLPVESGEWRLAWIPWLGRSSGSWLFSRRFSSHVSSCDWGCFWWWRFFCRSGPGSPVTIQEETNFWKYLTVNFPSGFFLFCHQKLNGHRSWHKISHQLGVLR